MYGIEATLPKASGGTSDPVFIEVQKRISLVQGDREIEVLHYLMEIVCERLASK